MSFSTPWNRSGSNEGAAEGTAEGKATPDSIPAEFRTCDERRIMDTLGKISYRLSLRLVRDPIWYGSLKLRARENKSISDANAEYAISTAADMTGDSPHGVLLVIRNVVHELRVLFWQGGSAVALLDGGDYWLGREAIKMAGCIRGDAVIYKLNGY